VTFTLKASKELATLGIGIDEGDACRILQDLLVADSRGRLRSEQTSEWLYVFVPHVAGEPIYVKLLLRARCVIVSFHEQVDDEDQKAHS